METVSLKEHFERLREADQRAVSAALASAEKAVSVSEINAEKWRQNANEWRAAMVDKDRNFFSKSMGYIVMAISAAAMLLTIMDKIK